MAEPLKLLWIDLRIDHCTAVAKHELRELFSVIDCGYTECISDELRSGTPDALCLDYDYPDRSGLRLLQELKAKYPPLPILMATLQHSEELAVWAFRSGVMDYFVKPIPLEDLRGVQARLLEVREQKRRQQRRVTTRSVVPTLPAEAAPARTGDMRVLAPAIHYITQNLQEKVSRDEAARRCSMTPFQFSRRFSEAYGIPFRDFVVRYRIQEACRLLENPATSITNVAFAVGFNDLGYFSRMFKQLTGETPSAAQQRLQATGASGLREKEPAAGPAIITGRDTESRLVAMPPLPVG